MHSPSHAQQPGSRYLFVLFARAAGRYGFPAAAQQAPTLDFKPTISQGSLLLGADGEMGADLHCSDDSEAPMIRCLNS